MRILTPENAESRKIPQNPFWVRLEVEDALKRLGIYPDQYGFRLLVMAVQLWIDWLGETQEQLPPQITKVVYPRLAKLTGKTPGSVERNMRWSIQRAMSDPERRAFIVRCFGCTPEPGRECFTTGQFVALLAQQIYLYGGVGPVRPTPPARPAG